MKSKSLGIFSLAILLIILWVGQAKVFGQSAKATIRIDTTRGHAIKEGASGFNVRIADKVWNYDHPEFEKIVHELNPGWLRFFSGTMGDAFNAATGQYDLDYAHMHDHQGQYKRGYKFTDVKGPHRIYDLYQLLGEVNGKLVVTVNGFTETPEITRELARFCKNNNMIVEAWQFCNEPYFYQPHRDRYWWNNGYDYAAKMKPHADTIRSVFPDARMALNFTWDGIWGFMKDIHRYQQEEGAYWNTFSKHSYAAHIGGKESFESAYKRANTRLPEVTDKQAMNDIEDYTWEGVPLMVTEFGVWNRPLNGIISAIYYAEYTLRQLQHDNAFLIGSHEVSNKFKPADYKGNLVLDAFRGNSPLNTNAIRTGINRIGDGLSMQLVHEATNHSTYVWETRVKGGAEVPGMKGNRQNSLFALAFKGTQQSDYLLVTNRSGKEHELDVILDNQKMTGRVKRTYIYADQAQTKKVYRESDQVSCDNLTIPPYSVMLVQWDAKEERAPLAPRIYESRITEDGIRLRWWKRKMASEYIVRYGHSIQNLNKKRTIQGWENHSIVFPDLERGKQYYFTVSARNQNGQSNPSNAVKLTYQKPSSTEIFKTATRDTTITVMWRSVPNASGYKVQVSSEKNNFFRVYDAKNVFGYKVEGLSLNVNYKVRVIPYNGLGEGIASDPVAITCKKLPWPARNVSARETSEGHVYLRWIEQNRGMEDVKYKVLRGAEPHEFDTIAKGVASSYFVDKNATDEEPYYTVKTYKGNKECAFYPNIATVIKNSEGMRVRISSVQQNEDQLTIRGAFNNVPSSEKAKFGVNISDVSYLNVEEDQYQADKVEKGGFVVRISLDEFKPGREYSIEAFVEAGGKSVYSLPPHETFKYTGQ